MVTGGAVQPHLACLKWCHSKTDKITGCRMEPRKIEQTKIITVFLVATDPLVVVNQVATAVQDQLLAVDLQWPGMMGRVPVHKINTTLDEAVREADLLRVNPIPPVRSPVC